MADKPELPTVSKLPLCYTSLTPLVAEHHGAVSYAPDNNFAFAADVNAVPLMAEEFPRAQLSFPIVFTKAEPHLPVALLGPESGKNDFVEADGTWRKDAYIPAYLRRYPFALVGDGGEEGRMLLCADLQAPTISEDREEGKLFEGEAGTDIANNIMDFCKRYEASMQRTRAMVKELKELDLLEESVVNIKRGEKTARIEGFCLVSEKRLRELDDEKLAGLTRRGVASLLAAHQFSIARFSGMFQEAL